MLQYGDCTPAPIVRWALSVPNPYAGLLSHPQVECKGGFLADREAKHTISFDVPTGIGISSSTFWTASFSIIPPSFPFSPLDMPPMSHKFSRDDVETTSVPLLAATESEPKGQSPDHRRYSPSKLSSRNRDLFYLMLSVAANVLLVMWFADLMIKRSNSIPWNGPLPPFSSSFFLLC